MRWIYWAGFLSYSFLVIYVGWRSYVRGKQAKAAQSDFWSAGKSLSSWAVGLSVSASFMSISWSCVYDVQLFYWYGLSAVWLLAIPWLLAMVGFFTLAPYFRKLPAFSQPEMLSQRFGSKLRSHFALPLAFVFVVWGGAEIFAAAQVLSPILEVPFHAILALIALVVAVYSFMGGFAAVVITDKVQYALVAFFIVAISWVAVKASLAQDTLTGVLNNLIVPPKAQRPALSLFAVGPALTALTLVAYLPGWLVETDIWLRFQAARSTPAARKGIAIAGVNSLLFTGIFPLIIGLAALYLYPPAGTVIPAELNDGAAIFAVLMRDHATPLMNVLLILGLAAASMSTIDTCGNVVALSLSYDLLEPLLAKSKRPLNRQRLSRYMSAGAVFLAYLYAIFTDSLWDIFYLSSGILTTTLFMPMMALFWPKATKKQVQASALAGFVSTLVFYFLESRGLLVALEPDWLLETGLGYILWGLAASLLGFWLFRPSEN
ncbi:MAG: sodium:solute symporter [bacterium]